MPFEIIFDMTRIIVLPNRDYHFNGKITVHITVLQSEAIGSFDGPYGS